MTRNLPVPDDSLPNTDAAPAFAALAECLHGIRAQLAKRVHELLDVQALAEKYGNDDDVVGHRAGRAASELVLVGSELHGVAQAVDEAAEYLDGLADD
jgi:hypothetical protein